MATKFPPSLLKNGTPNIVFGKDDNGDPVEIPITEFQNSVGVELQNDTVTPATDIVITAGLKTTLDGSRTVELTSDLTKSLSATWAQGDGGGLDTGTIVADSTYAVHIIENDTTKDIDILLSLSVDSPTLPVGWSLIRRIGLIFTDGTPELYRFTQKGKEFWMLDSPFDMGINLTTTVSGVQTIPSNFFPSGFSVVSRYITDIRGNNGGAYVYSIKPTGDDDPLGGDVVFVADTNVGDAAAPIVLDILFPFVVDNNININITTTYDGLGGARTNVNFYCRSYIDLDI